MLRDGGVVIDLSAIRAVSVDPVERTALVQGETAWARAFLDALEPHRAGVYVNFLDSDDGTSRVREAYGDDTYLRLAEVKAKYDPENVFHNNKNISPARRQSGTGSADRSPTTVVA